MIGEDYNDLEEEKNSKKMKNESYKKTKKIKVKSCTNCKELKLKIQELEQLNTKLMQTNKSLKQANKETSQKLNEALKENEILSKENTKLQKLLQELDQDNNIKNLNKKIFIKNYSNKDISSSDNEEEKEDMENEEKEKEEKNGIEYNDEDKSYSHSHSGSNSYSNSQNNKNIKKINKIQKDKINYKLNYDNENLLTNEVISDILDRLAELEKFKIYVEAANQTTDSKIAFLESKILNNNSRKSSEDIGVPTSINTKINKINKLISPLISKSQHRLNEHNKSLNDDIILSKSAINNYNSNNRNNHSNTSKKINKDKNNFNKKNLSENYIKSTLSKNKINSFKFNSKILNDTEDLDLIALGLVLGDLEKLKKLKVGYKLLYRASTHGDTAKIFHKKCDNIDGTLTVIKTKEGLIFGGYCNVCWESGDELIKEDLNSFVFSINLSKIYFVSKNNEPSILCDKNKGPSFIGMFIINNNMLSMKCEINPWGTQRYSGESSLYEINGGEPSFYIEEIEVFQVLFRE